MAGQSALLKPSTFVEGGGLVGDIDAIFKEVKFEMWDYNGKVPVANPAIKATLVDEEGNEHIQYWSAGQSKDWMASADGKTLVAVGNASGINSGSNAGILLTSIINAGFPEDKVADDISVFQGMKCHVVRQAAPKRNTVREPRADGRVYDETILVVSKIIKLPWEKGSGTTVKGAAKKEASGAGEGSGGSVEEKTTNAVMEVLGAAGKPLPKQQLITKVFQVVGKDDPDRNKIVQMVNKDDFLKSGPWTYEGGVVSM